MAPQHFRDVRAELVAQTWAVPAERRAALSDLTDEWLRGLFSESGAADGIGLVAVGGYGRRELSPGSDPVSYTHLRAHET